MVHIASGVISLLVPIFCHSTVYYLNRSYDIKEWTVWGLFWSTNRITTYIGVAVFISSLASYKLPEYSVPSVVSLLFAVLVICTTFVAFLYDWAHYHSKVLKDRPHNRLLDSLLPETGKEVGIDYAKNTIGIYGDILTEIGGSINRFRLGDRNLEDVLMRIAINTQFNIVPEYYDSRGNLIDTAEDSREGRISCMKIHLSTEKLIKFIEGILSEFEKESRFTYRILSTFQPYEWFYGESAAGKLTIRSEVEDLMRVFRNNFEDSEYFKRYILSNERVHEIQKELRLFANKSSEDSSIPWRVNNSECDDGREIFEIVDDHLFKKTYPFTDRDKADFDELTGNRFFIISTEDNVSDIMDETSVCNVDISQTQLLKNFPFGETYIFYVPPTDPTSKPKIFLGENGERICIQGADSRFGIGNLNDIKERYLPRFNIKETEEIFLIEEESGGSVVMTIDVRGNNYPNTVSLITEEDYTSIFSDFFDGLESAESGEGPYGDEYGEFHEIG